LAPEAYKLQPFEVHTTLPELANSLRNGLTPPTHVSRQQKAAADRRLSPILLGTPVEPEAALGVMLTVNALLGYPHTTY